MADNIRFYEKDLKQYRIILDAENPDEKFRKAGMTPLVVSSESKRKCIIMLALSIYTGRKLSSTEIIRIPRYEYSVEGREKKEYSGRYQLEVIPKYIMKELKDTSADEIEFIVLETKEVREPQNEKEIVIEDRICKTVLEDGTERNPSEAEFFISRILRYIEKELTDTVDTANVKFVEYYLSDVPRTDMSRLMDLVRQESEIGEFKGQNADIYIDIHGGPRGTQQLLINLLSILGEEGIFIDPNHILTVDVGEAPIKVAGESFRVNDFVSGIHEFTNYGRMNSLDTFYKNRPSKPEELLDAMRNVSYAIQVCDMATFEPALIKLAEKLTDFKVNGDRNDYLYSFMNLLVQGYDPLIKPAGDGYIADTDPQEEIKWCKKKGLYQQMLTLCESKIPEFLSTHPSKDKAIIRYDSDLMAVGEEKHGDYELYNYIFNRTVNSFAKEEKPTDGVYRANMDGYAAAYEVQLNKSKVLSDLLEKHFKLKGLRNHSNHGSTNGQEEENQISEKEHTEESLQSLATEYLNRIETILKMQQDSKKYPGEHYIFIGRDELSDEVHQLRTFIKSNDCYIQEQELGNALQLTNIKLRKLYGLVGAICRKNSVAERLQVLDSNDQSTIREIHKVWNNKNKQNQLTYDVWLREKFLTNDMSFWKKVGNALASCYNNPNFLYRLADIAVTTDDVHTTHAIEASNIGEDVVATDNTDVSLEQQVRSLAEYLRTNYESICTDEAPRLTNQKLQGLYMTLCAAEPYWDKSVEEKANAVEKCDIALLAYLFHQGRMDGRTDREWAKTALRNKKSSPYWINVGNKLQEGLTKGWLVSQL